MGRARPSKSPPPGKRVYSVRDIRAAVEAVRHGEVAIAAAAKEHHIPRSTLRDYIKMCDGAPDRIEELLIPGRNTTLEARVEERIKEHALEMCRLGRPLSYGDISDAARSIYSSLSGMTYEETEEMFGRTWFDGFIERKGLKSSLGQLYPAKRVGSLTMERVQTYTSALKSLGVDTIHPWKLWNVDETSIVQLGRRIKVVSEADGPAPKQRQMAFTRFKMIVTANAAGTVLPITLVTESKEVTPEAIDAAREHCVTLLATTGGAMSRKWFAEWAKECFVPFVPRSGGHVVVLDNDVTHHSIDFYDTLQAASITPTYLPPNSTDVLQPLDVSFFAPFKSCMVSELQHLRSTTSATTLSPAQTIGVIARALDRMRNPSAAIRHGFRKCGLFPFDTDCFKNAVEVKQVDHSGPERSAGAAPAATSDTPSRDTDDAVEEVCDSVLQSPPEPDQRGRRRGRPPNHTRVENGIIDSGVAQSIREAQVEYDRKAPEREAKRERKRARGEGRAPAPWAAPKRRPRSAINAASRRGRGAARVPAEEEELEEESSADQAAGEAIAKTTTTRSGRTVHRKLHIDEM